jgi:hypothetical protein
MNEVLPYFLEGVGGRFVVKLKFISHVDGNYFRFRDWLFSVFTATLHIWRPSPASVIRGSALDAVVAGTYEGVSKSFRIGRMKREVQMVQLSVTRCSCIAIL